MDRRLLFANARVKVSRDKGPETADVRTPTDHVVTSAVLDLLAEPGGKRDRQLLFNEVVEVLEDREGFAFVRACGSGYVGYVDALALMPQPKAPVPDHWVASRLTHAYNEPDIKSKELLPLSMGTQLSNLGTHSAMIETEAGWVPARHMTSKIESDPIRVAERLLGAPYLWGGNSANGIDCSGLVWIAFALCGAILMPDSDLQKAHDGTVVKDDSINRGDLWFWDGHVAIVVDENTLVHANAHHMAVVYESTESALGRIGATKARKRISLPT
jgi:prepilin-type processing-associated H-X9-DG protein